jgi:hypothetical protein
MTEERLMLVLLNYVKQQLSGERWEECSEDLFQAFVVLILEYVTVERESYLQANRHLQEMPRFQFPGHSVIWDREIELPSRTVRIVEYRGATLYFCNSRVEGLLANIPSTD